MFDSIKIYVINAFAFIMLESVDLFFKIVLTVIVIFYTYQKTLDIIDIRQERKKKAKSEKDEIDKNFD